MKKQASNILIHVRFEWIIELIHELNCCLVELRDTGFYGFLLPPKQIIPTGTETWAGLKAMIQAIAKDLGL